MQQIPPSGSVAAHILALIHREGTLGRRVHVYRDGLPHTVRPETVGYYDPSAYMRGYAIDPCDPVLTGRDLMGREIIFRWRDILPDGSPVRCNGWDGRYRGVRFVLPESQRPEVKDAEELERKLRRVAALEGRLSQ